MLPAQPAANYDESKVPPYTLPDPLLMESGAKVTSAQIWRSERRPELVRLFEREMFGRVPGPAPKLRWELLQTKSDALGGKAVRKVIRIHILGERRVPARLERWVNLPDGGRKRVMYANSAPDKKLDLLIYLPRPDKSNPKRRVPLFLGLNFNDIAAAICC